MKKRKRAVALCLAGIMAMSTIGMGTIGASAESTDYDVDNMTFDNVEIRVSFRYTSDSETDTKSQWYYAALEKFNEENEGQIYVVDESISTESDYEEKLTTDFASGDAPNAFLQYGGSRVLEYVEAGYVLDLTPYFEQYPDWYDGIQEFAKETIVFDGIDGTYGVPWSSYQLVMFYNKDYLEQVGAEVPESWDDLVEAAIMDGCSNWQFLWRILFPVCRPIIATEAIFIFISGYSELVFSLIMMTNSKYYTVSRAMLNFSSNHSQQIGAQFAFVVMSVIPMVIIYIIFHNQIEKGMLSGAIKG